MEKRSTEERIREKAYELWEADGRQHGRDQMHWDQAKEIIAITDSNESTFIELGESMREPVEPSIAFENQADTPDMADQGEAERGPNWQAARDAAEMPPERDAPKAKSRKTAAAAKPNGKAAAKPKAAEKAEKPAKSPGPKAKKATASVTKPSPAAKAAGLNAGGQTKH